MMNTALLPVFIPTFFFVSITPGMCMTLALTLGMTVGIKRAMWMMVGELAGVGLVAVSSVVGIAAVMLQFPSLFWVLKIGGGAYLFYLGYQLWRSRGKMAVSYDRTEHATVSVQELMTQGFITAIANPKGWAFFVALLPPFISFDLPLSGQLIGWVSIILSLEFACLMVYATGGKTLGKLLSEPKHVRTLNRIAGTLMIGVGIWLILG
uniref:Threonine efflux protein n=1 Tax=uncultured Thiotrichaceae bacterium TaxID=298394 RepID=A0A6S6U7G3_9GAMM|nr:MAG: Putative threonine efflux protein [uncultured Thiotrichaceae bacterium]